MSGDVLGPAADVWGSRDREFKVAECQAETAGVEVGVVAADRTVPRVAGGGPGERLRPTRPASSVTVKRPSCCTSPTGGIGGQGMAAHLDRWLRPEHITKCRMLRLVC
jgi:hypothetical protein